MNLFSSNNGLWFFSSNNGLWTTNSLSHVTPQRGHIFAELAHDGWLSGFNVDAISKMIYDGRSQFQVHTDEQTQVHSARLSLAVTHPSINRGRRALTSVYEPLS
jgi:hypothetical protein